MILNETMAFSSEGAMLAGPAFATREAAAWQEIRESRIACIPAPMPSPAWPPLYEDFDEFIEFTRLQPDYARVFDDTAKAWQIESGLSAYFSGYFSPYFRDRTGQPGKDRKQIIQLCEPYVRWLYARQPELLGLAPFRTLAHGLMAMLGSVHAAILPLVDELRSIDRSLHAALLPEGRMPPVAIRLLRYDAEALDHSGLTGLHVDKSAITLILNTDDPEDDPCLVFATERLQAPLRRNALEPVRKRPDECLLFLGAALREAGWLNFEAIPHAVRAPRVSRVRHSAIFFWLLPGLDLAAFRTAVPLVRDIAS